MEPDIPQDYNAAVFESKDAKLTIKEIPLEYPKHGEVLIKVLACGVCYSDVEVQKGSFGNDLLVPISSHRVLIFSGNNFGLTLFSILKPYCPWTRNCRGRRRIVPGRNSV